MLVKKSGAKPGAKIRSALVFGAVAGFAFFAIGAQAQEGEIKSKSLLGSCSLKIKSLGGSTFSFQPKGKSRTEFTSFYPEKAGELFLTNTPKELPNAPLVGGEPVEPLETLLINFKLTDGKIEPVSYVYDNVKLRKQTRQALQPETCRLK